MFPNAATVLTTWKYRGLAFRKINHFVGWCSAAKEFCPIYGTSWLLSGNARCSFNGLLAH